MLRVFVSLRAPSLVRQRATARRDRARPSCRRLQRRPCRQGLGHTQAFHCTRQRVGRAGRRRAGWADGLSAIFGLHVWPLLPSGTLASRPGPIMAAALQFEARVTGRGGHAAMPPTFVDPVVPAAAAIGALQARGHRAYACGPQGADGVSLILCRRPSRGAKLKWPVCRCRTFCSAQ